MRPITVIVFFSGCKNRNLTEVLQYIVTAGHSKVETVCFEGDTKSTSMFAKQPVIR